MALSCFKIILATLVARQCSLTVVLIYAFLIVNSFEVFFICPFATSISSLACIRLNVWPIFIVFFIVRFQVSFLFSRNMSFIRYVPYGCFLLVSGFFFHSFIQVLTLLEFWWNSVCHSFLSWALLLMLFVKTPDQIQGREDAFLFSCGCFITLWFTLGWWCIHSSYFLCEMWRVEQGMWRSSFPTSTS